jgi:hypothetical protein
MHSIGHTQLPEECAHSALPVQSSECSVFLFLSLSSSFERRNENDEYRCVKVELVFLFFERILVDTSFAQSHGGFLSERVSSK